MKMYNEIKGFKKNFVYDQYTRIVEDFKDYEKITKVKMLDAIYKIYDNPGNIVDICTTRELKYLEMLLDGKVQKNSNTLFNEFNVVDKYDWEKRTLQNKFLLDFEINIPEEIVDKVKQALKCVNWKEKKKIDDLNEILVSYCKIQGTALVPTVCQFASCITGIPLEDIGNHMLNNKLFNYYVFIVMKNIDGMDKKIPVAIFEDYIEIANELGEQRKKQGLAGTKQIDIKMFKTLFYNDFDINNPKIKKFLEEIKRLPFFWYSAIEKIKEYAMLNIDRKTLKESIKNVPMLQSIDLTDFFKTLDEAMDEMPSGALNGYTPNEAKAIQEKNIKSKINKAKKYVRQQNACLSKKDSNLFYEIYFGLLDFTNKMYKIKPKLKIYNHIGLDPYELQDIVVKYWENKDKITEKFCLTNPYKFNEEELSITMGFKKGIRNVFIIAKYELEYTAFMDEDKLYMVKGLNCNIDEVIPYDELPYIVMSTIIPFKNNLVYDGLIFQIPIVMGDEFEKLVEKEYDSKMKYYHL